MLIINPTNNKSFFRPIYCMHRKLDNYYIFITANMPIIWPKNESSFGPIIFHIDNKYIHLNIPKQINLHNRHYFGNVYRFNLSTLKYKTNNTKKKKKFTKKFPFFFSNVMGYHNVWKWAPRHLGLGLDSLEKVILYGQASRRLKGNIVAPSRGWKIGKT